MATNLRPGRAQALLQFIRTYKREHDGCAPTIREMCEGCGIGSTSSVRYALGWLEGQGLIAFCHGKVMVVGGQWVAPGD